MVRSTIVEIIRAYQPFRFSPQGKRIYNSRNYQSLLALLPTMKGLYIYNSRNYQSLLAIKVFAVLGGNLQQQKLLELTSLSSLRISAPSYLQQQKLLEPTSQELAQTDVSHLQQQKLLEPTSPVHRERRLFRIYNSRNYQSLLAKYLGTQRDSIYNSRNYQSLLACIDRGRGRNVSTIVEIIRAYQPAYLL